MKSLQFFSVLLLSAVVAFTTVHFSGAPQTALAVQKETRWEQIKKRGTLRCGYIVWPPFHMKDPNTGEMSGIMPDIMKAITEQMSLKLEWVAELDPAHMFSGYHKYDAVCVTITLNGARARETAFTRQLGFAGYYAFTRANEDKFAGDLLKINDPNVRIATIDGEYSSILAQEIFPKAQTVPLGQLANGMEALMHVMTGKADIALTEPFSGQGFMENNPDKIKLVSEKPVQVLDFALPIPHDEPSFKSALDTAITNLHETGALDRIYRKYEKGIAYIHRPAHSYQDKE